MLLSLLVRKKVTKETHPGKPLRLQRSSFAHSGKIREQFNSLRSTALKQKLLVTGFFPPSPTGLQGAPFRVLEFTLQEKPPDD